MKTLCEEDDVDMFYKSIAMTVKKMSPQAIKEAKLRTLTLITEIDDKYSTPQMAQTLPYQVLSNNNNMYQCQLSSPAQELHHKGFYRSIMMTRLISKYLTLQFFFNFK